MKQSIMESHRCVGDGGDLWKSWSFSGIVPVLLHCVKLKETLNSFVALFKLVTEIAKVLKLVITIMMIITILHPMFHAIKLFFHLECFCSFHVC